MMRRKQYWGNVVLASVAAALLYVVLTSNVFCGNCKGSGRLSDKEGLEPCPHCHGQGVVVLSFKTAVRENNTRICPQCNGTAFFSAACPACNGNGEIPLYKKIALFFSPGTGS